MVDLYRGASQPAQPGGMRGEISRSNSESSGRGETRKTLTVDTLFLELVVLSSTGTLRPLLPQHPKLLRRQLRLPFRITLLHGRLLRRVFVVDLVLVS